jgi:hypothetical protein
MSLLIQGNPAFQAIEQAMRDIGYRDDLLRRGYEYTNVLIRDSETSTIELAGFAQSPPSYRNACIGVTVSNGLAGQQRVSQHRALGAPLVFEIDGNKVNRWKITSGEPELKEVIPVGNIAKAFDSHKAEWEPESILRVKAIGESKGSIQLDFFDLGFMPFLESRNFEKLDYLLHEILNKSTRIYRQVAGNEPRFEDLFPLAFRFIAAKVFRDRGYPGGWTSNDAESTLSAIERHYNVDSESLPLSATYDREILQGVWDTILSLFRFPNLSEDDLALVFEETFITPQTRKTLGIHSTPPRVAEYIIRKLPIHEIPQQERYVLEPFTGHGRFLVAAMRQMRDLLPGDMSDAERHRYFVPRLVGIEIDRFSVEVCRLSLMLADYPNPNGWKIHNEDVFSTQTLDIELRRRARIVLCNPPYEDFTPAQRKRYDNPDLSARKPAELLRRLLVKPPELLGLVLPRVFESGASYRTFHRQLAETYGHIELLALPEVFNYSEALTTVLLATDKKKLPGPVSVACRQVREGVERELFIERGAEPSPATALVSALEYSRPDFSLWIPPLSRIWTYLKERPLLRQVAQIHRGIMWIGSGGKTEHYRREFVSTEPKAGYFKGHSLVHGHLEQYSINNEEYLSMRPEDQYDQAYKLDWKSPKVVCNEHRMGRGPWRLGAVADPEGLAFSARYIALWPNEGISIYSLTALLNSPVCNAFLYAREAGSVNRITTLRSFPLPDIDILGDESKLGQLSKKLHDGILKGTVDVLNGPDSLLEIDAEILKAYQLPPILEREILDTFQGVKRPLPFQFGNYYPPGFDAYIPLHEIISPEFFEARADRLLQRLTFVNDPIISEAMTMLHSDHTDDEGLPS